VGHIPILLSGEVPLAIRFSLWAIGNWAFESSKSRKWQKIEGKKIRSEMLQIEIGASSFS
jgi:hypothetical protein